MGQLTEAEVRSARVSGTVIKMIGHLVKKGHEYIKAKKMSIKANFINFKVSKEKAKHHKSSKLQIIDVKRAVIPKRWTVWDSTLVKKGHV